MISQEEKKDFLSRYGWLFILPFGLIPLTWFEKGLLLAGGDEYQLLNPNALAGYLQYAWNIKLSNFGGVIFAIPKLFPMLAFWQFFKSLGFSQILIEKLWLILSFLLPGLTMYYFMSQIYNHARAKIIASLLYLFNLYNVVTGPFPGNIQPVLTAFPLMMVFWIKGLKNPSKYLHYSILIGLSSLIYAESNANPPSVAVIPLAFFCYLIFHLFTRQGKLRSSLKFSLTTFLTYFLFNLWWLANFLVNFLQESGDVKEAAAFKALGAGGPADFFRLLGSWGWRNGHYQFPYFSFAHFYDQPFLLILSFSIPFLVFSALLLRPKNRHVQFFSLLALLGIFLAKGAGAPFGLIYQWLFENLPGFWTFREPFAKFTPLTFFAYSVLIGFTVQALFQKIKNYPLESKEKSLKLLANSVFLLNAILILVVAYPLLNGEMVWDKWNGSMRTLHAQIPGYWQELKDYLEEHDLEHFRILTFPSSFYGMAYNWPHGFSSADNIALYLLSNPIVRDSSLFPNQANIMANQIFSEMSNPSFDLKNYLGFLNIKYVLQENDVDWRYSGGKILPPSVSNQILKEGDLHQVAEFGRFSPDYLSQIPNQEPNQELAQQLYLELENQPVLTLYEIDNQDFLPHFYIPQEIIFLGGSSKGLADIVSFGNWEKRSGIYLGGLLPSLPPQEADQIILDSEITEGIEVYLSQKQIAAQGVFYTHAKYRPGDLFFPLVILKERFEEWLVRGNPEKLVEKKILYAGKRITEFQEFSSKSTEFGFNKQIIKALNLYSKKMNEAIDLVEKLSSSETASGKSKEELGLKIEASWEIHREHIETIIDRLYSEEKKEEIVVLASQIFSQLEERLAPFEEEFDWHNLIYNFSIPKEGEYEIGFQANDLAEMKKWQIKLDNKNLENSQARIKNQGWIFLGSYFLSSGNHQLNFRLLSSTNLISRQWRKTQGTLIDIEQQSNGFSFQDRVPGSETLVYQELEPWQPHALYYLGFDYQAQNNSWQVGVVEEKLIYLEKGTQKIIESISSNQVTPRNTEELKRWKKFETILNSSLNASRAIVFFRSLKDDREASELEVQDFLREPNQIASLEVKNLTLTKLDRPRIIIREKKITPTEVKKLPELFFSRINPTKYKVEIKGATQPYFLVFSETFHQGWKAYPSSQSSVTSRQNQKIMASYFDGQVNQGEYQNKFFSAFFETWGQKSIPEKRHLIANGYANSWQILPEDVDGAQNYELIIEFRPQRLFYLALAISFSTLFGSLIYLSHDFPKVKTHGRRKKI